LTSGEGHVLALVQRVAQGGGSPENERRDHKDRKRVLGRVRDGQDPAAQRDKPDERGDRQVSLRSREATRRSILRAARTAFVAKGFHEATTHDVAREAGLSVGSIYTYFKNKDDLIRESVLAANKDETDAVLRDVRSAGTVREKVARAITGWYAYTIEAPGVPAFLAEAWAAASRKPMIRDLVARRRERIVTVATLILHEGVTSGEVAPGFDVDAAARALAALLDGVVLERIESGASPPRIDVERRALLLLGPSFRP
jgi:AcrR family transcriptional regulator